MILFKISMLDSRLSYALKTNFEMAEVELPLYWHRRPGSGIHFQEPANDKCRIEQHRIICIIGNCITITLYIIFNAKYLI